MRSVYETDLDSQAIVAGEYLDSDLLKGFSLKEKETQEAKDTKKRHTESWKTNMRKWRSEEKKRKAKLEKKIEALRDQLPNATTEVQTKNIEKEIERLEKSYYSPTDPPFPASDVSILTQAEYLAGGEYIEKPYDLEDLTNLVESSQRLKSSIKISANNSVGLGQRYRPTKNRNVADFSSEELEEYHNQGKELLDWYNSRVEIGKKFYQKAFEVDYDKFGLGEGYFEVADTRKGSISAIRSIKPTYIFEGKNRDRYIWIKNGKKKYFKRWEDKSIRNSESFEKGSVPVDKMATRLIPYREYNLVSDVYGVPPYTGSIPQILGGRYAAERNVNQQLNDGVPRLVITVAGGAVDDATKNQIKKYFQLKGKGRENAGRVMLLCVNSKNALSPNSKPPVVTFEPLTVGKTDDASFMKYQDGCNESVREAFRMALTFYGSGGTEGRAAAFTLRDQVVRTVFLPEAKCMENLCNDTFTREWAIETGRIKVNSDGEITEDNLFAELAFVELSTMSQKDERELAIMALTGGALTVNDFRAEILGMPKIDSWIGDLSKSLAISALQFSEISPRLVATMIGDDEFLTAIEQDTQEDESKVIDDTTKAIIYMRKGLSKVLEHKHVDNSLVKNLEKYYSTLADSLEDDDSVLAESLRKLRDSQ
jgi:capsid portal protein